MTDAPDVDVDRTDRIQARHRRDPAEAQAELAELHRQIATEAAAKPGRVGKFRLEVERVAPAWARRRLEPLELDPHETPELREVAEMFGGGRYRLKLWYAGKLRAHWYGVEFPGAPAAPDGSIEAEHYPAGAAGAALEPSGAAAGAGELAEAIRFMAETLAKQQAETTRKVDELLGRLSASSSTPATSSADPLAPLEAAVGMLARVRDIDRKLQGDTPAAAIAAEGVEHQAEGGGMRAAEILELVEQLKPTAASLFQYLAALNSDGRSKPSTAGIETVPLELVDEGDA